MTITTILAAQKSKLTRLYQERETLENTGIALRDAKKLARKTLEAVTEAIPEGSYGSPLDPALASLDDVILKLEEVDKQGDERAEQVEREIVVLESTRGVLCRCHGEVECEDQAAYQAAPYAEVIRLGERQGPSGRPAPHYRASLVFPPDQEVVEGTNGHVVAKAEEFWVKHGFDKHGAYKHVLALCERLDQEAATKAEQ